MTPVYRQYKDSNYLVSLFGTVKNVKTGLILKQEEHYRGHMKIGLSINGKKKKFFVHRLVAQLFLNNPKKKGFVIVNHKDCDKKNNFVSNLEWTTISGNTKHAVENGLIDMNYVRSFRNTV